jgi:predicted RND superfamily exporter protein
VAAINSTLDPDERRARLEAFRAGAYELVFMAPEALDGGLRDVVLQVGDRFIANLGASMFVLLPGFALWLKLVYIDRHMRYTEHLVYALHVHAFWFAMIALAGFTINTLTLLALVLAIGLVVDDAFVVLENIYRHIEEGMAPFQAAIKGVHEISFAVVAMTLTLAAVFAPLAFTPGRTGRLFGEFALTLAGAVLVSGFVALTLTPMMCSKLLRHIEKPTRFDRGMERLLVGLSGRVISSSPSSKSGRMTWCLNLVRSVRPAMAINAVKAAPVLALARILTWCRLGA